MHAECGYQLKSRGLHKANVCNKTFRSFVPQSCWKFQGFLAVTTSFCTYKKKMRKTIWFSILKENGSRIINEQPQVAEIFNDYFTNITDRFTIYRYTPFQHQSLASRLPANSTASKKFTLRPTNHHEVRQILNDIKQNKAQGYYLIPPRAVKQRYHQCLNR